MTAPDLIALVSARICHDLVSPLGAIGNGVELLGLTGLPPGPEMALISESVDNASARLRFFRIAFGTSSPDLRLGRAEIAGTLAAVSRGGRVSFDWRADGDQPRDQVRAVFLLLQCLETALPHGGAVQIAQDGTDWVVTADSPRLRFQPDLWQALTEGRTSVDVTAAQVQFALLPAVLSDLGRRLSLSQRPDGLTLRL